MFKNLARVSAFALAAMYAAVAVQPLEAQTPAPLKVGFVYVSPIGAAGWTYQMGRVAVLVTVTVKVAFSPTTTVAGNGCWVMEIGRAHV